MNRPQLQARDVYDIYGFAVKVSLQGSLESIPGTWPLCRHPPSCT